MEHDRGTSNGHAEVVGTVVDQWGGALAGATVRVRLVGAGRERLTQVREDGQFRIAGLAPGEYRIEVSVQGKTIARNLAVEPRDRAVLSVLLRQETAGNAVSISKGDMTVFLVDKEHGFGAGFGGGIGAGHGVAGGVPGDLRATNQVVFGPEGLSVPVPLIAPQSVGVPDK